MFRRRIALVVVLTAALLAPPAASAAEPSLQVTADLDGKAIPVASVPTYHCNDFDYPRIHCFETAAELETAVRPIAGLLGVTSIAYVRIFENVWYGGASMIVSQDYTVLATVAWNDRISSFQALNSETGSFHWDWFYGGGTPYTFCCNQGVPTLGIWNDNISSVHRT
jgi:hypothetical protein